MDVHVEIDSRSGGCSAHAAASSQLAGLQHSRSQRWPLWKP